MKFNQNHKIIIGFTILTVVMLFASAAVASYISTSKVNIPVGTAKTDSFTYTATLNGTVVADPANINIPVSFVGDTDIIVYTVTSTANQPITVNAIVPTGGTLDKSSVTLASNGATGTFTLTVTVAASAQTVNVNFSSNP